MRAKEEGVGMNDLYQNTILYLNIPLSFFLLLLRLPYSVEIRRRRYLPSPERRG
jgi:hypothetical protein